MTLRDWYLRLRALAAPRRVERELDEELAFHIERDTHKYLADGLTLADARTRARARFGSVPLAADLCRDARGTAPVDALVRDIVYAWRTFRRAPLVAVTIIATVALGLGLVTVVFIAYNIFFLRLDAVQSPGELFAVERLTGPGADAVVPFTRSESEAIRRETNVFTGVVAMLRPVRARIEGRPVISALVTGNFFQLLGVRAALGRTLLPDDDERSQGQPVLVLSHRGWQKLFREDPTVIGRSARVNGRPYEIVGVMPEDFRGLAIGPPDYWAPLVLAGEFRDAYATREDELPVDVIVRLKPGTSPESAAAALTLWASRHIDPQTITSRLPSIRLRPRQGTLSADVVEALMVFMPIFFVFGLVLMIGCANVANLLLARGLSRQREIGIRLSLGASRRRIIRQLLTESALLALAAAACGLAVARLFLQGLLYAATTTVPAELVEPVNLARPTTDWRVLLFLVGGAMASTMLVGLAPALQSTRLDLVRTMRGELAGGARPDRARHALIALQVGASAVLLICAAIFLRGALAAATVDPGVRTSDTLMVTVANEPRRAALLHAVTTHPSVAAVAAWSEPTLAEADTSASMESTADSPISSRVSVEQMAVSPEYFEVLGIDVVNGRAFTPAERTTDVGVAVVSETAARRLWPNRNAIGQVMRLRAPESNASNDPVPPRTFTVVGVARDVGGGLRVPDLFAFRGVYVPTSREHAGTSLTLRVRGGPEQARQALLDHLTGVDPGLGSIITMQAMAAMQTYVLQLVFWVAVGLAGLALVLTVSGLFSVLSYVVEQRSKDIGVRTALGATTRHVAGLVVSQSLRPVGVGLIGGGALAAGVAGLLSATTAASDIGSIVQVFDPLSYASSVLLIITSCLLAVSVPAFRAARLDPVATLRQD